MAVLLGLAGVGDRQLLTLVTSLKQRMGPKIRWDPQKKQKTLEEGVGMSHLSLGVILEKFQNYRVG